MSDDYDHDLEVVTQEMRIVRGLGKDGTALYSCHFMENGENLTIADQVIGLGMIECLRVDYLQRLSAMDGFPDYESQEES